MNNVNDLFNDTNLYTKEEFEIFVPGKDGLFCTINQTELKRMVDCIGFGNNKIITKCKKCKKEFPFDYIIKNVYFYTMNNKKNYSLTDNISIKIFEKEYLNLDCSSGIASNIKQKNIPINILENKMIYLVYYLTCTNCSKEYMMYTLLEQRGTKFILKKIGQYPSMLDVHGFDFSKYKSQLDEINAYEDYKKADLSFTEGFYVGSFAYLRRIFEKIINKYLKETEEKPVDNHMESKLKVIKNRFDPRIQDSLKNVYDVLSISIHELDEDQSKESYSILKAIIDIQLEYEYTEDEKNKNAMKYSNELAKITSKIKLSKISKDKNSEKSE